jgi:hypothetical protein
MMDLQLTLDELELLGEAMKFAYGQTLQDEARGIPSTWSAKLTSMYRLWCKVAEAERAERISTVDPDDLLF